MDIKDIQKSFILVAAGLGDFQSLSKTELANGYCDAEDKGDDLKKSQYWAALMLRYWYKIFEWSKSSASCKLPLEYFLDWLHDSLCDAFYYRSWRWEYEAVVKNGKLIEWKLDENGNKIPNEHYWKVDENAPDKSINYFCAARRAKEYQALNKDKRKTSILAYSLDASKEEVGDSALEKAGAYEDGFRGNSIIKDLVIQYLNSGRTIEALILDGISYQDSFKEEKEEHEKVVQDIEENDDGEEVVVEKNEKYYVYKSLFDKRRLVKHLNTIDQQFMNIYFTKVYNISEQKGFEILSKLKKLTNATLYKYVEKTLIILRKDLKQFYE